MAWLNGLEAACHPGRAAAPESRTSSSAVESPTAPADPSPEPPRSPRAAESPAAEESPAASPEPSSPATDMDTATLAALYVRQGLFDRALSVYERMLERDPGNTRLAVALEETRRMAREANRPRPRATPSVPPDGGAARDGHAPSEPPAAPAPAAPANDAISIRAQLRGILDGEVPGAAFLEASRREWLDGLGSLG